MIGHRGPHKGAPWSEAQRAARGAVPGQFANGKQEGDAQQQGKRERKAITPFNPGDGGAASGWGEAAKQTAPPVNVAPCPPAEGPTEVERGPMGSE